PDALALSAERSGEIDRQRRLADAALSARDRDHSRGSVERDAFGALGDAAAELGGERRFLLGGHDVEVERDAFDAGNRRERLGHLLLEARPQRAAGDGQRDRDGDIAAADPDVADHVELGDRTAQLRVDDLLERLQDLVARALPYD